MENFINLQTEQGNIPFFQTKIDNGTDFKDLQIKIQLDPETQRELNIQIDMKEKTLTIGYFKIQGLHLQLLKEFLNQIP